MYQLRTSAGNPAANQFVLETKYGETFQSYRTNIAAFKDGKTYIDKYYWDYSATTGKYRNKFLGESIAETRKKIASGEYILTNLNK